MKGHMGRIGEARPVKVDMQRTDQAVTLYGGCGGNAVKQQIARLAD